MKKAVLAFSLTMGIAAISVACGGGAGGASAGSVDQGRKLITAKGCSGCHTISSIPEARGTVGPPLDGLGNPGGRPRIAGGTLDNTAANLEKWLSDPPAVKPGTMMPNLGLSAQEKRDLVAFLETLK